MKKLFPFVVAVFLFIAYGVFAETLTQKLKNLYVKKAAGEITQGEYDQQKAEIIKMSQDSSSSADYSRPKKSFKEEEQPCAKSEENTNEPETSVQRDANQIGSFKFSAINAITRKDMTKSPADLNETVLIVFCSKYWKAHEMVRLSQDMQLQTNGSTFYGETVDEDPSNYAYFTKKFVLQLPNGVHDCRLTLPVERRRAYGNQNNQFGNWCPKTCEFKFSVSVNGRTQDMRVIDFFKKPSGIGNFDVGEKFLTRTEYDSLLKSRSTQEVNEKKDQAFYAALAIIAVAASDQNKLSGAYYSSSNTSQTSLKASNKRLSVINGTTSLSTDDEISLFDSKGNATAYIAEELTVYLWSGKPVAYLENNSSEGFDIYGFNGKHLGWLVGDHVYEHSGKVVGATRDGCVGAGIEPFKSFKQFKPFKAFKEFSPFQPFLSLQWSSNALKIFLLSGSTS